MMIIFTNFINDLIGGTNIGVTWSPSDFIAAAFYIEKTMASMGLTLFENLQSVFYSFAMWLLILKFCQKGFETYILGIEGDIDSEPTTLILRYIKAIVVIVLFPMLYQFLADITIQLSNTVTDIINHATANDFITLFAQKDPVWDIINSLDNGLLGSLVLFIGIILLTFQIYMRGAEMFILRLGFPIACIGLLESDNGVFAPYAMMFFKSALTSLIQISLFQISLYVISLPAQTGFLIGICFLTLAISTPKFLQQFLVPAGSSGVTNKIYMATRVVGMITKK